MTAPGPAHVPTDSRDQAPWYKRRAVLVAAALVVIVAITVVTDLPQHNSRRAEISGDKTVMSEVDTDVGPCSYAVGESFTIYGDVTGHSLTRSETSQVPGLLRDDQAACSFVDDSIYQLSTIGVPGTADGKDLGQVVNIVTLWATSDALSAIEQIQILCSNPSNAAALKQLVADERMLRQDGSQANAELDAADSVLRTKLPALSLAQPPATVPLSG